MLSNWEKPTTNYSIDNNKIYVWLVNLKLESNTIKNIIHSLSNEEINRANKFYFEKDKYSFIGSHVILRQILSKYIDIPTKKIIFDNNKYGKPFVKNSIHENFQFNLSHSENYALIGVTSYDEIGVDIEHIKDDFIIKDIANNYFSKGEIEELFSLPNDKQRTGFFNCWTRKEAYIKAEGKGLSIPLNSFDVTLDYETKIKRIGIDNNPKKWELYNLSIDENYCAAIANYGSRKEIIKYYINDISKYLDNIKKH